MQRFLQLIVLTLSRDWELFSNSEFLLAGQQKYCEMKLLKGCYTVQCLKNALQQSWRKVEPDSTSCNASYNKNIACLYDYFIFSIFYSALPKAGSPQQREPITVVTYYLTHPVNFPCGRKPEYSEKTHDFRQSVYYTLFSGLIARQVTPCNFACDLCRNKIATSCETSCIV